MSAGASSQPLDGTLSSLRTAWVRGLVCFCFWLLLLPSMKPSDLIFGGLVACGAVWVSVRLLPPEAGRLRFIRLLTLLPHFLFVSVLAGVDVARRALDPKLPLNPGFVDCPVGFPPGFARNTFATITSLLPGSVPVGDGGETLLYHCLDLSQPLVEALYAEERLFARALVVGKRHG